MPDIKRILVLCTGNSCRSQMAEGYLRELGEGRFEAHSAGTEPAERVHPLAVKAMAEDGIDISAQRPKDIGLYDDEEFDLVITVCDSAKQSCPMFLNARENVHWSLEDPAEAEGTEEERMTFFRQIRDRIRERVERLVQTGEALNDEGEPVRL
ncbi:MAG: arsenate reductase ArsC [candidate division WS1 bacterium]|jgi:arsenate reductase|nr:arsenate reductase ArsC [candidate division WS1 bacterium]